MAPKLINPLTALDNEMCGKQVGPDYEEVVCYYEPHPLTVPHYDDFREIHFWTKEEWEEKGEE